MQIYNDLTAIYKDCFFSDCQVGDVVTIKEQDGNPKVVDVTIQASSEMTYISSDFLHWSTVKYYKDNQGKPEVQHDCDGIMLVRYQNNDYLVLIELKSDYNRENIKKAEKQLAASYFRIMHHLQPLSNFNCYTCKVCGIIVSLPIDTSTKRDIRNKKNIGRQLPRFEEQADHFIEKNDPYMLDDRVVGLSQLPVHNQYIIGQLPLFHVDANPGSTTFDLYKYLRKL